MGLYNGQRLEGEPEDDMVSYSRVTEGSDRTFVRILLLRGRVQGAVMIGETGKSSNINLFLGYLQRMHGNGYANPSFYSFQSPSRSLCLIFSSFLPYFLQI